MDRRVFLATTAVAPLISRLSLGANRAEAAEPAPTLGWRQFEVTTRVTLQSAPGQSATGPAQLWLPLAQTAGGYQTVLELHWQGNGRADLVRDQKYGAAILRSTWDDAASPPQIEVVQLVATRDRGSLPSLALSQAERQFWTEATQSAPTDGIVRDTALRITAGRTDPHDRLRAIYDWVVDTTWRNPETPGCGLGDVKLMLETGNFGGKCVDINGLMVGLARSAGFPARDVYGIRVADSRVFPSLGKSGDISKAQHCRAEVFLEDAGWFPVDPADVRKVVLEQKLALDSPDVRALRERLFGAWEMNWIGYNSATDIKLPGAGQEQPNFAFLMYPCAFTPMGQPSAVDPARFRYEISSREILV
jgi:transglutaminase-like putative cysteine protease